MNIQINNLGNVCSFNYRFLDYCDDAEADWERCGVNYRPFTSLLCYFNFVDSTHWNGYEFLVVSLGKNKCLFVNMDTSVSCFFDPSCTLEDISLDIMEAVEDDDELAALLSSIILSQFLSNRNPSSVSLRIPDNSSFSFKS